MINWKFYIASSNRFADKCNNLAMGLEDNGAVVTRKWWKQYIKTLFEKKSTEEFYAMPETQLIRELDFKAIDDCDIMIVICNYWDWDDNIQVTRSKEAKTPPFANPKTEFTHMMDNLPDITEETADHWSEVFSHIWSALFGKYAPLTGALIEAGYAEAKNKILIYYGNMKRSAMVSGAIHCRDEEDLWRTLGAITT